jgi:hypothetical protein
VRTPTLAAIVRRVAGVLWRDAAELHRLRHELRRAMKQLAAVEEELRVLRSESRLAARTARRIELASELDNAQRGLLVRAGEVLDERRLTAHVQRAILDAEMRTTPAHHLVVEDVLPADAYALLLEAIPPDEFFDDHDRIKQNLSFPLTAGPALTRRVWGFMDEVIAGRVIRDTVIERFGPQLREHFDTIFGPDARARAEALPFVGEGGRLMLRRPGYGLRPHRDPKRSMLTCLLYLARPGDDERYGTQLFEVGNDTESRYKQTYYPEGDGLSCRLVATVPYRPNSMLVMLNSAGAHGVRIPADEPADVKRFSYQFYVAPENTALSTLIKSLPKDRRAMWRSRDLPPAWWRALDPSVGRDTRPSGG